MHQSTESMEYNSLILFNGGERISWLINNTVKFQKQCREQIAYSIKYRQIDAEIVMQKIKII